MTEADFCTVVELAGVKANKVRSYLTGHPVNAGVRLRIVGALDALGMPPCPAGERAIAERRALRAARRLAAKRSA